MICEIIQGFKKFGWNKKNKDISSSKNKAFARLQWITKKDRGDILNFHFKLTLTLTFK